GAWSLGREGALAVGGLAAVVALLAANASALEDAIGALGDQLFKALGTDVAGFALPLAFSRFAVPGSRSEGPWSRTALALAVGGAALTDCRLRALGRLQNFELLLAIQ
ncbi:unnamed protein product, partial [Polarella glacialis]